MDNNGYVYDQQRKQLMIYVQKGINNWYKDFPHPENEMLSILHTREKVTSIGTFQFEKSYNLSHIIFENGLRYIGEYSFGAAAIQQLRIPASVENISHCAFVQCEKLEHVVLENGVIRLEDCIFSQSRKLKTIEIPPSVICLDEGALDNTGLQQIIGVKGSVADEYCRKSGMKLVENGKPLSTSGRCGENLRWVYHSTTKELIIEGMGEMWDYGWKRRSPWRNFPIEWVTVQEGVTSIGRCAFLLCLTLKGIRLPCSLKYVSDQAFKNCVNLHSVDISVNQNDFSLHDKKLLHKGHIVAVLDGDIRAYLDQFEDPDNCKFN